MASNARTVDHLADNFPRHLARLGWEEGKTYRLHSLTASGNTARLSQLAAELVQRRARVIVGVGNQGVRSVQGATQEIPIVGLANDMAFAGSDEGGRRAAAIYSLIETAKINDVDPLAWLADVLARIQDHPAKRIEELLPWHWTTAQQQRAAA